MVVEQWRRVLRRRWKIGAALWFVCVATSAFMVFKARPIWRADATLRLGTAAPISALGTTGASSGLLSMFSPMSGDPFANELELLRSRTVTEGVTEENALNVDLDLPRGITRDSVITSITAGRSGRKAVFDVALQNTPKQFTADDVQITFKPWHEGLPRTVRVSVVPFGEAVRRTGGRLLAERKRREANLVSISYNSTDGALALDVVNSTMRRYGTLRAMLQRRESGETVDSLHNLATQTMNELRRQENEMELFQRQARIVAPEVQGEVFVKKQADVLTALQAAQLALSRAPGDWASLLADPFFAKNTTLAPMLSSLVGLKQQRLALAVKRTPEDPQIRALDEQIAYVEQTLERLIGDYRKSIAAEVRALSAQAAALDSTLVKLPAGSIELGRRQRNLRLLSEVYLFTDQRARQQDLRDALSFANVQVVDPPELRYKPVWPRKKYGLGVGMMLGLLFGILGMALRERVDDGLRDGQDVRNIFGAPIIAALPRTREGVRVGDAEREAFRAARLVVLAPLTIADEDSARALSDALRVQAPVPVFANGDDDVLATTAELSVEVIAPVSTYAAVARASGFAAAGATVMVVASFTNSRRSDAVRAAELFSQAGTQVRGIVLIDSAKQLESAW